MMRTYILCIATWITTGACVVHSHAQPDSLAQGLGSVLLSDGAVVLHDAGKVFGAPLHFSGTQWLLTGSILAGTAILFTIDESARSLAQRLQSHWADNWAGVGHEYGREVYGLAVSAGLYGSGILFNDQRVRETGLLLFESIAMAGAITTVLKSLIGRSRPYLEEGPFMVRGLQFKTETTSLPSGHTTVAFAVSSVLAGRLKNPYIGVGLYSVATLTALSRVYHDAHWVSDNVFAAAIATCVGLALVDLHDTENRSTSIRLEPCGLGMKVRVML